MEIARRGAGFVGLTGWWGVDTVSLAGFWGNYFCVGGQAESPGGPTHDDETVMNGHPVFVVRNELGAGVVYLAARFR